MKQDELDALDASVAETLRSIRGVAGISQAEMERRTGIARTSYRLYEKGQRQPDINALARIVEACETSLTSVMEDIERIWEQRLARLRASVPGNVRRLRDPTPPVPESAAAYRTGKPTERELQEKEWGDDPA